jgi:hypothetical protein
VSHQTAQKWRGFRMRKTKNTGPQTQPTVWSYGLCWMDALWNPTETLRLVYIHGIHCTLETGRKIRISVDHLRNLIISDCAWICDSTTVYVSQGRGSNHLYQILCSIQVSEV